MLNLSPVDAFCGSNLIARAQQALVVDQLQFARFEELCTMLELLVLSDRIYYLGESPRPGKLTHSFPQVFQNLETEEFGTLVRETPIETTFNGILEEIFGQSVPAGIIRIVLDKGKKGRLDDDVILAFKRRIVEDRQQFLEWFLKLISQNGEHNVEVRYFLRAFLYEAIGRKFGVTVVHDGLRAPLIACAGLSTQQTNFNLYWRFVHAVRSVMCKQADDLYIRPIPAVILSRCDGDRGKIIRMVGELRGQFRDYRAEIRAYHSLLGSDAASLHKQGASSLIEDGVSLLVDATRSVGRRKGFQDIATDFLTVGSERGMATESVKKILHRIRTRPARKKIGVLFDLLGELVAIEEYPDFIKHLWPSTPFARANPFNHYLETCKDVAEVSA